MTEYEKWELIIKAFSVFALIVAGVWAFHRYSDTKEKEYYSEFWNKKMELYLETSSWASIMATTSSVADFNEAREEYYQLFYGRLSLVEGNAVKKAMQDFSGNVPKGEVSILPIEGLDQKAYQLTISLKKELGESWRELIS